MRIIDIAINNIKRRRAKAAFVLAGLSVGVATVVTLTTVVMTMDRDLEEKLDQFGANIVISPRTEGFSMNYGGLTLGGVSYQLQEISEAEVGRIDTIKNRANIQVIAPKTLGVVDTAGHSVILAGIDIDRERALKKWWSVTGTDPGESELLAGARVAENLGLSLGSSLAVNGEAFVVTGFLAETGSADDEILFTPLPTAQRLLGKEGVYSLVEVSALCKDCPVDELVAQISEKIPTARVSAVQQVVKAKMQALDQLMTFSVGVIAVVLFIGALMVLVTMMNSVKERTREIGILRAIGYRRRHIVSIILSEAALISVMAGLVGWGFGLLVAKASVPLFVGAGANLAVNPLLAVGAVGLALVVGLGSSAYPAFRAVRLAPGEALRILY